MSIDARIEHVQLYGDGSGEFHLIDRPASRQGDNPGCAGQGVLSFDKAPLSVMLLEGKDIWGGGDGPILLGDKEIGRRMGYTRIVLCDERTLQAALVAYARPQETSLAEGRP